MSVGRDGDIDISTQHSDTSVEDIVRQRQDQSGKGLGEGRASER